MLFQLVLLVYVHTRSWWLYILVDQFDIETYPVIGKLQGRGPIDNGHTDVPSAALRIVEDPQSITETWPAVIFVHVFKPLRTLKFDGFKNRRISLFWRFEILGI